MAKSITEKKGGITVEKNVWEAMHLLKTTAEVNISDCINELLKRHFIEYVREKNIPDEMFLLIEKKLKAVEE